MIKEMLNTATKKGRFYIGMATIAFTVGGLLNARLIYLVISYVTGIINDGDIVQNDLIKFTIKLLLIVFMKLLSSLVADVSKHYAGFDVETRVRETIVHRLKRFSIGFFTNERLGEIETVIHKDVQGLEAVVGHFMSVLLSDVLIAAVIGIFLFIQSPFLGLAMLSFLPIALLFLILGYRNNKQISQETNISLSNMVSTFIEYVKGMLLQHAFI